MQLIKSLDTDNLITIHKEKWQDAEWSAFLYKTFHVPRIEKKIEEVRKAIREIPHSYKMLKYFEERKGNLFTMTLEEYTLYNMEKYFLPQIEKLEKELKSLEQTTNEKFANLNFFRECIQKPKLISLGGSASEDFRNY